MKTLATLFCTATTLVFFSCSSISDCCASCDAGETCQSTEVGDVAEWRTLIGDDLAASWSNYGKDTISSGWQVVDGTMTMTGGGGDIVTNDLFGDFELELEWKVAAGGNSGVFFNVTDGQDTVWRSGIEMQILDNGAHHDGKNPLTSAGSCYALYKPARDVTNKPGEWNQVRVVNKGEHVEHWLNGTKICEYTLGSDDWNQRVAASKFKSMPMFGLARRGRIALQDHGDEVSFRNFRVRDL